MYLGHFAQQPSSMINNSVMVVSLGLQDYFEMRKTTMKYIRRGFWLSARCRPIAENKIRNTSQQMSSSKLVHTPDFPCSGPNEIRFCVWYASHRRGDLLSSSRRQNMSSLTNKHSFYADHNDHSTETNKVVKCRNERKVVDESRQLLMFVVRQLTKTLMMA